MASTLPTFPRFVFTILEPIALVAGYLSPILDTTDFINSQLPATSLSITPPTATNRILALQLGNVYGLLAMVGVSILYTTTEAKVVRNFLLACAIADVGHLYVTYAVMYVFLALNFVLETKFKCRKIPLGLLLWKHPRDLTYPLKQSSINSLNYNPGVTRTFWMCRHGIQWGGATLELRLGFS